MKKKVLILGIDGYIGFPLAFHLLDKGYEVSGIDNFSRRDRVKALGLESLTPIAGVSKRMNILGRHKNFKGFRYESLHGNYFYINSLLNSIKPDVIVHLAEQPSAPWSMQSAHYASETQYENVIGTLNILWAMKETCPDAHLLKLGTMGEYGTPNCNIPEGKIPEYCIGDINKSALCPMEGLPFPKTPGSFYHLSKVHDTNNIIFACRNWGLSSTDIMQGVVFGLNKTTSEPKLTRFDYDEHFGTCINRFCVQSLISHPLTIYGKGNQTRGYLPLKDSIQCLTLAIDNPPKKGEYRVFNQYENIYSINELANLTVRCARDLGLHVDIEHIHNPRKESETHYYNPTHSKLSKLGYKPDKDIQYNITELLKALIPYKDRVDKKDIMPKTTWE